MLIILILGGFMFKVVTKNNTIYVVRSLKDKPNGVIFEYEGELLLLPHSDIKSIDTSYEQKSPRTYVKKTH